MNDYSKEIEQFNEDVEGLAQLTYIVRDSDLQRDAIVKLSELAAKVHDWKRQAIADQSEDHANIFLGCECAVKALQAELEMWLQLKNDKPDDAWNKLIVAQMATRDAVRSHPGFSHLEARAARLVNIERVVFPKQVFFSAGLIVERQQCSICGTDYDECAHVAGKPYMGQMCSVILRNVAADHVAIVDEPANKQCRVVEFSDAGGRRNRMTWRLDPEPLNTPSGDGGLTVNGVIFTVSDLSSADSGK